MSNLENWTANTEANEDAVFLTQAEVDAIWSQEDDRIPLNTPRAQLTNAEHIAKFRNARAIEKIRNAKPLPVSPRKEAKLRSAITKLKMESV